MAFATILVTLRALAGYLAQARKAQQEFNEAANIMKQAAEALCNVSQGDWAAAFAKEQDVYRGWCTQMSNLGTEYMDTLQKAMDSYEATLEASKNIVSKL